MVKIANAVVLSCALFGYTIAKPIGDSSKHTTTAVTANFDNLPTPAAGGEVGEASPVPSPYKGVKWAGWNYAPGAVKGEGGGFLPNTKPMVVFSDPVTRSNASVTNATMTPVTPWKYITLRQFFFGSEVNTASVLASLGVAEDSTIQVVGWRGGNAVAVEDFTSTPSALFDNAFTSAKLSKDFSLLTEVTIAIISATATPELSSLNADTFSYILST